MTPMCWFVLFREWGLSQSHALLFGHACHNNPGAVLRAIARQTVDAEAETVIITKGES